jgi:TPR repeat protein
LLDSQVIRFEWIKKKQEDLESFRKLPEPATVLRPLNNDEMATLRKLGQDLLQHGDISAARVVLKRAAAAGDVEAMLQLGMTFDPAFLAKWGVLGFAPDLTQAHTWYDRAMKLGSTEASRNLERLASMPK